MLKKFFIFLLMLSFLPLSTLNANVRLPENLRTDPFDPIVSIFGDDYTSFRSGFQSTNSLTNSEGLKAEYIQLYVPYHVNIGLYVDPEDTGNITQASILQFREINSTAGNVLLANVYDETTTDGSSIRRGLSGYSTIIPVPRNATSFNLIIETNTRNSTTVSEIEDLLNAEMQVQMVFDTNFESYQIDDLELDGLFNYYSYDNLIPSTAVSEMLLYVDNTYNRYYDTMSAKYSRVTFYDEDNNTLEVIRLLDTEYAYTTPEFSTWIPIEGYYYFNLDTPTLTRAVSFEIRIFAYTNPSSVELQNMNDNTFYNFDDDIYFASFYNNLTLLGRQPFSRFRPKENFELPNGFREWTWINDETNISEPFDDRLIPMQNIQLYSNIQSGITIPNEEPTENFSGGVFDAFDRLFIGIGLIDGTINTNAQGQYTGTTINSVGGMSILFLFLLILLMYLIYKVGGSSFTMIIVAILLTSLFMFLGYLPLFASIILIGFFIVAIIGMSSGGMLSE